MLEKAYKRGREEQTYRDALQSVVLKTGAATEMENG